MVQSPAFLGSPGSLSRLELDDVPVSRSSRSSVSVTLSGRRVVQFGRGRDHRSWSVSRGALPVQDWNRVELYAAGVFGRGPFIWLDPWATVSNVLSCGESILLGWGGSGWERREGVPAAAIAVNVEVDPTGVTGDGWGGSSYYEESLSAVFVPGGFGREPFGVAPFGSPS